MSRVPDLREIERTAARAAAGVPGVARLSPRPSDRLRPGALGAGRTPGVRVVPRDAPRRTDIEIALAVRGGHQATAVAAAVRSAVFEAVHGEFPRVWGTRVSVSVTVTDIV
ncbi:Asp23/Gls24 family envelope stress response protein [Streptomyces sp. HPF1205]|uniref:Asp23/Gls24 family envelope stress response protein n=1 Tax=Streptomyces sp. HPF1205 TaxID=2873262 RepID=UPI001CEC388E|nr:Asp23/Gls24 family envelope stress response protein [Streptomyces sp. HPF1205]